MSNNILRMPGVREISKRAPKSVRSTTEAVILTKEATAAWLAPSFQRPLRVNAKVSELADSMKNGGGIIPGILTIGVLDGQKYLVDGQHRVEAFKLSELSEAYAEIRICHFDAIADMAEEFVTLNSKLVTMKPDDILRGLEASSSGLMKIVKECEFVGYDYIRRGPHTPIVSMSVMLRCWFRSAQETPAGYTATVVDIVKRVTDDEAMQLVQFLKVAYAAWNRDVEYQRLWGSLNLTIIMWLWRRLVNERYSAKSTVLSVSQFGKCMMSLSASSDYLDWLGGRNLGERDRSPCYSRIRTIFASRILADLNKKAVLPSPPWYLSKGKGPRSQNG